MSQHKAPHGRWEPALRHLDWLEEEIIPWQEARDYPFQLHTQASIRVSDNKPLLETMWRAGFDKVFVGIESPVKESLKFMGARKNLQGNSTLLDKVRRLQENGFEVQAGFIIGLDTDPDDIAERMIAFIREAGIPVAMVGILGVLRDTPDYKRFKRAGRLIEGTRYIGDSGVFNRHLSYVPLIDPDELIERHRQLVGTLNSPEVFFERCLTLFEHKSRKPLGSMPIGWSEVRALFLSLWKQGLAGSYRRIYWKFLVKTLVRHTGSIPDAVRLAIQGHHLITTTQQALRVDQVKTYFEEAITSLEKFTGGSREAFTQVENYTSRLLHELPDRFAQIHEDCALQVNADILLRAAKEYCEAIRGEFQHHIRESFEKFQKEVEQILVAYANAPLPQPTHSGESGQ